MSLYSHAFWLSAKWDLDLFFSYLWITLAITSIWLPFIEHTFSSCHCSHVCNSEHNGITPSYQVMDSYRVFHWMLRFTIKRKHQQHLKHLISTFCVVDLATVEHRQTFCLLGCQPSFQFSHFRNNMGPNLISVSTRSFIKEIFLLISLVSCQLSINCFLFTKEVIIYV